MFHVNIGSFTISIFQQVSRKSAKFEQYLLLSQVKCTRRDCVSAICRTLSYMIEAGSWPNLRDSVRERSAFFSPFSCSSHRLSDVSGCQVMPFKSSSLLNRQTFPRLGNPPLKSRSLENVEFITNQVGLIFVSKNRCGTFGPNPNGQCDDRTIDRA